MLPKLLLCGGASGHLMHPYDNLELTFGELKSMISDAAEGRLQRVTEKFDGMNLVFTWNGELRVARSGSDIRNGGMDAAALAAKFHGRGNVETAFKGAFTILREALSSLSSPELDALFDGGNVWYSIEVVYAQNPNVINYDRNWVILHDSPVFRVEGGKVIRDDASAGAAQLSARVARMQRAVTNRSWQIRGPAVLRLVRLSDGSVSQRAIERIQGQQSSTGLNDSSTIGEYLIHTLSTLARQELSVSADVLLAVVRRTAELHGAPKLPSIKKSVSAAEYAAILQFVRRGPELVKLAMEPIVAAVHEFAVEMLRGLKSALVDDHDREVQRIRAVVDDTLKTLRANAAVQAHAARLGNVENITASAEGIVFLFKGQAYKFTGSFAPVNQILGMVRYDRTTQRQDEAATRDAIAALVERMQRRIDSI